MRTVAVAIILSLLPVAAHADVPTTAPLHGGVVARTGTDVFETLITPQGVRVFVYTDELGPANVGKAIGTARLKLPDGRTLDLSLTRREPAGEEPKSYFCPMHPQVVRREPGKCELCGGMILYVQDHLFGPADLAGIDPGGIAATIRVTGLGGGVAVATFMPAFSTPEKKVGGGTAGRN